MAGEVEWAVERFAVWTESHGCERIHNEILRFDACGLHFSKQRRAYVPTRKRIALQALYGLNYLHSRDCLHRDVSYNNVLVRRYDGVAVIDLVSHMMNRCEQARYILMSHYIPQDVVDVLKLRRGTELTRTKLALFQSKRLYPNEQAIDEAEMEHYAIGFARLFVGSPFAEDASAPRSFQFLPDSTYPMILAGDAQVERIAQYGSSRNVPVHYLLYNPATLPWAQSHPLPATVHLPDDNDVGCRVVDSSSIRNALLTLANGDSPSYDKVRSTLSATHPQPLAQAGWRLEDFIERVVTCQEGYRADSQYDDGLEYVFNRRSGPIAAAIGVTITAPEDEQIFG